MAEGEEKTEAREGRLVWLKRQARLANLDDDGQISRIS